MNRILMSGFVALAAIGIALVGATGAFFSDTELSTGNTFAAGTLDLKIDNESYYNGNFCAPDVDDIDQDQNFEEYVWQGQNDYPVIGTPCDTSFPLSDLGNGLLFFNFTDLKPDDEGEDTISLHVQNNAYACMEITLTSNDDRSSSEPELLVDDPDTDDAWDGELAQNLQFVWWADDGDNVLEHGERILTGDHTVLDGVQTLYGLATSTPWKVALADSQNNVWDPGNTPGPILANESPYYIGKAWCFGDLTIDPVPFDEGVNPSVESGVHCDGSLLGNETQTDGATLDVAFSAVQARNNPRYLCGETSRLAKITVIKNVINDNGGNNSIPDFSLFVDNGIVTVPVTSGVQTQVTAGSYLVTETGVSGYVGSFGGDCDAFGNVTLNAGDEKTCTIINNDLPAAITLVKVVTGSDPLADPSLFGLKIDGGLVPNNTSIPVNSNAPHLIDENGRVGYHFVSITGAGCPASTSTPIVLNEGESITCTITNAKN